MWWVIKILTDIPNIVILYDIGWIPRWYTLFGRNIQVFQPISVASRPCLGLGKVLLGQTLSAEESQAWQELPWNMWLIQKDRALCQKDS